MYWNFVDRLQLTVQIPPKKTIYQIKTLFYSFMYHVFEKLWFSIQETDFIYVSLFEVFFCKRQRNHFSKDGISGCAHKAGGWNWFDVNYICVLNAHITYSHTKGLKVRKPWRDMGILKKVDNVLFEGTAATPENELSNSRERIRGERITNPWERLFRKSPCPFRAFVPYESPGGTWGFSKKAISKSLYRIVQSVLKDK